MYYLNNNYLNFHTTHLLKKTNISKDMGSVSSNLQSLLKSLPNTSGIMPPVYADEWIVNKSKHIKAIKDWIDAGAKDMYGNAPVIGNPNPVVTGFSAFHNNSTTSTYSRPAGAGILPILIPRTDVDLWFSIDDDLTSPTSMTVNEIKIDTAMFEFDSVAGMPMTVSSGVTVTVPTGSRLVIV